MIVAAVTHEEVGLLVEAVLQHDLHRIVELRVLGAHRHNEAGASIAIHLEDALEVELANHILYSNCM